MIPKRVQVAGVVAAVSLVGYFASALSDPGRAEAISFRLPKLTTAEVDEISLTKNNNVTVLQKTAQGWRITSPKFGNIPAPEADQTQIDGLIGAFKDGIGMDLSESYDPSKGSSFGLDKDVVTVVLKNQGKELANFQVGKKAAPGRTFILPNGEPNVYRAMADLRRMVDKEPVDLRLRNMWQAQFENITEMTIQDPTGAEVRVKRVEGPPTQGPLGIPVKGPKIWEVEAPLGATLDNAAVDGIARALAYPRAAEFVDNKTPQEVGIGSNFRFVITTSDGSTHALLLGNKDEQGRAYAQREPDGDLVLFDKFAVDSLLKSPFPPPPASAPTSSPSSMPASGPAVVPTAPPTTPPPAGAPLNTPKPPVTPPTPPPTSAPKP